MKKVLELRNVTRIYRNANVGLRQVDLDLDAGEFLVLLGRSGSGKSTLLKEIRERTAGRSAMIFQQFNLIERHTVWSNVLYGALGRTPTLASLFGRFAKADQDKAIEALEVVGLRDRADQRVNELSGGQKQRVAIARALLQGAEILLADEPAASLDPVTARNVMRALNAVRALGLTVVCSLHDVQLAKEYATRVVGLRDGAVVYNGSPTSIPTNEIYGVDLGGTRGSVSI